MWTRLLPYIRSPWHNIQIVYINLHTKISTITSVYVCVQLPTLKTLAFSPCPDIFVSVNSSPTVLHLLGTDVLSSSSKATRLIVILSVQWNPTRRAAHPNACTPWQCRSRSSGNVAECIKLRQAPISPFHYACAFCFIWAFKKQLHKNPNCITFETITFNNFRGYGYVIILAKKKKTILHNDLLLHLEGDAACTLNRSIRVRMWIFLIIHRDLPTSSLVTFPTIFISIYFALWSFARP